LLLLSLLLGLLLKYIICSRWLGSKERLSLGFLRLCLSHSVLKEWVARVGLRTRGSQVVLAEQIIRVALEEVELLLCLLLLLLLLGLLHKGHGIKRFKFKIFIGHCVWVNAIYRYAPSGN
jgi:hypothetical protein